MSNAKTTWRPEEDEMLQRLVCEYGDKKWAVVATHLGTKGSKQCRRRWSNFINPHLKTCGWTKQEDEILIEGQRIYGNRWTEISKLVRGRTDNAVKNRWAILSRRILDRGDSVTINGNPLLQRAGLGINNHLPHEGCHHDNYGDDDVFSDGSAGHECIEKGKQHSQENLIQDQDMEQLHHPRSDMQLDLNLLRYQSQVADPPLVPSTIRPEPILADFSSQLEKNCIVGSTGVSFTNNPLQQYPSGLSRFGPFYQASLQHKIKKKMERPLELQREGFPLNMIPNNNGQKDNYHNTATAVIGMDESLFQDPMTSQLQNTAQQTRRRHSSSGLLPVCPVPELLQPAHVNDGLSGSHSDSGFSSSLKRKMRGAASSSQWVGPVVLPELENSAQIRSCQDGQTSGFKGDIDVECLQESKPEIVTGKRQIIESRGGSYLLRHNGISINKAHVHHLSVVEHSSDGNPTPRTPCTPLMVAMAQEAASRQSSVCSGSSILTSGVSLMTSDSLLSHQFSMSHIPECRGLQAARRPSGLSISIPSTRDHDMPVSGRSVMIQVLRECLTPSELQYIEEINQMSLPIRIHVTDVTTCNELKGDTGKPGDQSDASNILAMDTSPSTSLKNSLQDLGDGQKHLLSKLLNGVKTSEDTMWLHKAEVLDLEELSYLQGNDVSSGIHSHPGTCLESKHLLPMALHSRQEASKKCVSNNPFLPCLPLAVHMTPHLAHEEINDLLEFLDSPSLNP